MMLSALAVAGYRSLRDFVVPLRQLTLVTGPERQRQIQPLSRATPARRAAQGRVIPSLAREAVSSRHVGGSGTLLARRAARRAAGPGHRGRVSVSLRLGFAGGRVRLRDRSGLPPAGTPRPFLHDPEIKREVIWSGPGLRPSTVLVDRRGPLVRARRDDGEWDIVSQQLSTFDSMYAVRGPAETRRRC
jgi:predicted ATPase